MEPEERDEWEVAIQIVELSIKMCKLRSQLNPGDSVDEAFDLVVRARDFARKSNESDE